MYNRYLQNDDEKYRFLNKIPFIFSFIILTAAFLRSLEADAAERTRKRKERGKIATLWKEKGNTEFKAGNYRKAIEHYTEGMTHLKDMVVLYTNRAQVSECILEGGTCILSWISSS